MKSLFKFKKHKFSTKSLFMTYSLQLITNTNYCKHSKNVKYYINSVFLNYTKLQIFSNVSSYVQFSFNLISGEGEYIVSVVAFNKLDEDLISSVQSEDRVEMIAQTLPQVTAARLNYFVIVGRPVTFNLTNHKPKQKLGVKWILKNEVFLTDGSLMFCKFLIKM